MRRLVYDLPTRLFHWLFAFFFLTSFVIGKTVDDESLLYSYHMISGLMMTFLILLRIVWGISGTQHARFSSFALNPKDLIGYFKGILTGSHQKWSGHNPASSWAAIAMMALGLGLGLTGYQMAQSSMNKENLEDIHELFGNVFILVVIGHITGIVLHTIRHKEMIGLSMVDGKKAEVPEAESIPSAKIGFGFILIALIIAFGVYLNKNFNQSTRQLNLMGQQLSLGESAGAENGGGDGAAETEEDND